jgi:tRNA(Ile)-lysidine synthase TilS/MesJ
LLFYQFPDKDELEEKVRAIFLSYYAKEWSFTGNTEFAVARGLRGRPGHDPNLTGRLNPYCSIDSDMQIVNQMLKYYKLGFGFVTDEVCYDLREGRLSREEAIRLVEQYDGKCDERYIHEFCEYIDISAKEFWQVVDRFVNKKLFRKDPATREWKPLFKVGYGLVSS